MDSKFPIRKIIHVDMGAFYASVEQRDNPELQEKPTVHFRTPNVANRTFLSSPYPSIVILGYLSFLGTFVEYSFLVLSDQ